MIYPCPDKLDQMGSKYSLVIVAAKRARQIKEGARNLVDSRSANPLTVALEEVAASEIIPIMIGDPEAIKPAYTGTPVMGGLVATSLDDESARERTVREVSALLSATDDDEDDFAEEEDDEIASLLEVEPDEVDADSVDVDSVPLADGWVADSELADKVSDGSDEGDEADDTDAAEVEEAVD